MSRSEARPTGVQPAEAHHASARLGLTLRSILLAPKDGYAAAFRTADRRARAGTSPAEGVSPYLFAALGGAALVLLWLKLGSLLGLRSFCTTEGVGAYVTLALVLGGLIAVGAQVLWSMAGAKAFDALHTPAKPRHLRLVWGASAFPQSFALAILLPLDLLLVGRSTFTSQPLNDSVSTAWAAFSIAAAISLSVWSIYLFVRGVEVASSTGPRRAAVNALVGVVCLAAVVAVFIGLGMWAAEGGGCPTRLG